MSNRSPAMARCPANRHIAEERNRHGTGRHRRAHHQRALVFLNGLGAAYECERRFNLLLVERPRPEEIEINGNAMAQMKRDGGPAIEHE